MSHQYSVRTGPIFVPPVASDLNCMWQGYQPERPRERLGPRIPLPLSQETHVSAPFTDSMFDGKHPDKACVQLGVKIPLPIAQSANNVAAPFSEEMVRGKHPDNPILPFAAKQGITLSQPTHVSAASTDESMFAGQYPGAPQLQLGTKIPLPTSHAVHTPPGCTFVYVMVEGNHPDQPRTYVAPGGLSGAQTSQPTHVPAPFSVEMSAGLEPPSPRLPFKPAYAPEEILPPQHFDFTVEYFEGYHPDRPIIFLAPKLPSPDSQLTAIVPVFFQEMIEGTLPSSPRAFIGGKQLSQSYDDPAVNGDCTFEIVDVAGYYPPKRSLDVSPYKGGWQQWTPDVVAQDIAQVQGSHPDFPRPFLAPRIPLPDSQVSPTGAADSPEMWAGWARDVSHGWQPLRTGLQWFTPDVIIFDAAMVQGVHPDQPRIYLGPRIPLPLAQTTQVNAPFFPEMILGSHPDQPRLFVPGNPGWINNQITPITTFSIEMILVEGRAERPRLWLPLGVGKMGWHPENVIPTDAAQLEGAHIDQPRLFLAPRIALPFSQTTQVSAPFSAEMVMGNKPDGAPRLFIKTRIGLTIGDGEIFGAGTIIGGPFQAASRTFTFQVQADADFIVPANLDFDVEETTNS